MTEHLDSAPQRGARRCGHRWRCCAIALAWDMAGLDLPLARLAGTASGFPWREQLAADHRAARRRAPAGLAAGAGPVPGRLVAGRPAAPAGLARAPAARPRPLLALAVSRPEGRQRTSCPWDLRGSAASPATCRTGADLVRRRWRRTAFPAGHAASGFASSAATSPCATPHPARRAVAVAAPGQRLVLGWRSNARRALHEPHPVDGWSLRRGLAGSRSAPAASAAGEPLRRWSRHRSLRWQRHPARPAMARPSMRCRWPAPAARVAPVARARCGLQRCWRACTRLAAGASTLRAAC